MLMLSKSEIRKTSFFYYHYHHQKFDINIRFTDDDDQILLDFKFQISLKV